MNQFDVDTLSAHTVSIDRCDRWQIYQRLQDLDISCQCFEDGTLRVDVPNAVTVVLLRSVVQQFTCSRQELADWLDRCWQGQSS